MYIRLAFGVAAHLEPEVLIVDEVLAVGDAEFQQKCLGKMKEVSGKGGRTVLFVSHNIGAVRELCSRAILVEAGRIKADGSTSSVVDAYRSETMVQSAVVDLTLLKQFGPGTCCKLHALHLLTAAAQPTTSFTMNEPLVARILLETTSPVRRLEVGMKISSRLGVPIHYFTSSWEGLSPDLDAGFHWFEVKIPALLVYPGTYVLGLWASKPSQASDVNVQDVTSIEVLSANFTKHPHRMAEYVVSGSEVYAPSEWKLWPATLPK
jgi:lipopolysaccharide transport system ATP-binding protein